MKKSNRQSSEINSGSMADIAFLLLIFFLVTTTIASDKGISILLPPKNEDQQDVKLNERNIFNILINSNDQLLLEDEPGEVADIQPLVSRFLTNNGKNPKSSESPQDAVVSLKTDRGTTYEVYINVYDELKVTYNRLRAEFLGITLEQYNELDKKDPEHKEMLDRASDEFPFRVSDAEPTDISKLQ